MRKLLLRDEESGALVDDADFARVEACGMWNTLETTATVYAVRHMGGTAVLLHRFIVGVGPDDYVDHRNGNGLDCQRDNLRVCTCAQNHGNRRTNKARTSSRFKGVGWHKAPACWRAYISIENKHRHIGHYPDEVSAALAYDARAREVFGEFAALNFPGPGERGALR